LKAKQLDNRSVWPIFNLLDIPLDILSVYFLDDKIKVEKSLFRNIFTKGYLKSILPIESKSLSAKTKLFGVS
jgi:hypothetical protein